MSFETGSKCDFPPETHIQEARYSDKRLFNPVSSRVRNEATVKNGDAFLIQMLPRIVYT